MDTATPPLTPIRQYMSPIETSPTYREQLRRRTSSFSSNHDRSPVTPKSRHRFSNGSQFSNDFDTPIGDESGHGRGGGGGMGNLADELDQLDDDDDVYYEEDNAAEDANGELDKEARDSGIDVSYNSARRGSPTQVRNFSKPFGTKDGDPPGKQEGEEDRLSPELEDLMNSIARMTSYASSTEDPIFSRTIALLQDLGNQSSLEAATQRLTTSTNSMTAHLTSQSKSMHTLTQSLYPIFTFSAPLDPAVIAEAQPMVDIVMQDIPQPDTAPLQKLQRLDRETADVISTLSQLTDTLQMAKQITATASRHLRTTQTMVVELRREQERADLARHELAKTDWQDKIHRRWCGSECQDIMSGFEERCNALRASLEAGTMAAGA